MAENKRRLPRQARAAATVDAILEATLQLLDSGGVDGLTTNHIAKRAGVSVGTLYQYFDSKADVLAALAERHARAVRDEIAQTVIERPGLGSVRAIVRALVRGFEGSSSTQATLLGALLARDGAALARHHEAFLAAIAGKARLDIELTPERAFVLTHAAITLLHAAAAAPSLRLDPACLEDEIVRLMESYAAALATAARTTPPS